MVLGACAATPARLEAPLVAVARVEAMRARGALVLELALVVDNPNRRPLRARALDWEVAAAGRSRVRGRAEVDTVVPPGQSVRLDVDCWVGPGAAAGLVPLLANAALEVSGVLQLDAAHGRVEWRGQVPLR